MEKEMAVRKQESRTLPANEHKIASQASIGQLLTAYRHPELSGFSFLQERPVQRQISIGPKSGDPVIVVKDDENYKEILKLLADDTVAVTWFNEQINSKKKFSFPDVNTAAKIIIQKAHPLEKAPAQAPPSFTEEAISGIQGMLLEDESDGNLVPLLLYLPGVFGFSADVPLGGFRVNPKQWVRENLKKLKEEDFYSHKAIRDHLISLIFKSFPKVSGEDDRPNNYYIPQTDPLVDTTLHHIKPWNKLRSQVTPGMSEAQKSGICWRPDNLVAGSQNHRIMDPGPMVDVEAARVKALSGQTITTNIPSMSIATESPKAHMWTDTLQFIFAESLRLCKQYGSAKIPTDAADLSTLIRSFYTELDAYQLEIRKAIRRFKTVETEFDFSIPFLENLHPIVLGGYQKLLTDKSSEALKKVIQEVCPALGAFVDAIRSMAPGPSSKVSAAKDELDPDTLLTHGVTETLLTRLGGRGVYNPPATGNDCFFRALLGPRGESMDMVGLRRELAAMIGRPEILRPGAMITTEDIAAIFANPAIRAKLGINGVAVYLMLNGDLHPVPMVFGTPDSSSPILVCLNFAHYIRIM